MSTLENEVVKNSESLTSAILGIAWMLSTVPAELLGSFFKVKRRGLRQDFRLWKVELSN